MKMFALLMVVCATTAFAGPRDPVGESAYYEIDRNSARTSRLIKGGNFEAIVAGVATDTADAYTMDLNYKIDLGIFGQQTGKEVVDVEKVYFDEQFLIDIRVNGTYQTTQFKVKHEGYADARTMDGSVYKECDILLFYDIDTSEEEFLTGLFQGVAQLNDKEAYGDIEDLKIRAHVKYGIPVLGAAKLDVSGYYSGQFIKAGADYKN